MKELLLLSFLFTLFLSGCQTREDKAAKLIKDAMFKHLYDFSSYEPIETKIDSAFTSIYRDSIVLIAVALIDLNNKDYEKYQEKLEEAEATMRIFSGSYYNSYGDDKYKKAKRDADRYFEYSMNCIKSNKNLYPSINMLAKSFTPTFCGWQAIHTFRCKTKGGFFDIGHYLFVFDMNVKTIQYIENLDDEDYKKMKEIIDSALEN